MKEDVLPEGWELKKLGSVVQYEKGKKPSNLNDEKNDIFTIPYIDIQGFEKGIIKSWTDGKNARLCQNSDLLMVWDGARAGLVASGSAGALGSTLMKISFPKVNHTYGFYFLYSKFSDINSNTKGTGIPHVDPSVLWNFEFPIPPLPEQQYLSQKLTALLDEVAQTKQRLEAIPALLKQFRQSVLADAVSGRLTDSDKYKDHKLKDYFDFIDGDRGPNYPKKDEYSDKGYCLFLSTKNVREFGFDFSECIYISQEKDSVLRKGKLNRDDVIITTRGTLGNVASYDKKVAFDNVRINSGMLILRKKENNILNEYSKILIASPLFKKMITDKQTGSAQPQLPAGILKEFEVPIPSIEQQTQIVQKVETYFALADEIETQVKTALENVNLLTQSILAKAFSGELSAAWRTQQAVKN